MLLHGDQDGLWHQLEAGQPLALVLAHVPWLGQYYVRTPGVGEDLKAFRKFAVGRAMIRRKQGSLQPDLFRHLIDEDDVETVKPTMTEVVSDGGLAIIAGSDTAATTMSNLFFFLLSNPTAYARLQHEVDANFPPGEDPLNASKHARMDYLNAVINESLRLLPPVPSGSQRCPPKGSGGKVIGDHYIPEGTSASIHCYTLHHDPRNFSPMTDEFWPERWLTPEQLKSLDPPPTQPPGKIVHNANAFIPFSYGPAICVGKALAYQEMRMVICSLMQTFDMRFEDGWKPQLWEDNLMDWLVFLKGKLPVVFTPRNGRKGPITLFTAAT